jgi:hypothetical protein
MRQARRLRELVGLEVVVLLPCLLPVRANRVKWVRAGGSRAFGYGSLFRAGGRCRTACGGHVEHFCLIRRLLENPTRTPVASQSTGGPVAEIEN